MGVSCQFQAHLNFLRQVSPIVPSSVFAYLRRTTVYALMWFQDHTQTALMYCVNEYFLFKKATHTQAIYQCLFSQDERTIHPLTLGCISSFYYLHHTTVRLFREKLYPHSSFEELLQLLCVRYCVACSSC